jgi:DNA replication protein DnaC
MTRTVTAAAADDAAAAAVAAATRELHLPAIRDHAGRLATQAQRSRATYLGFLADTLSIEVDERAERRRRRLIHEARFPRIKRIVEFNVDAAPTISPATIATLAAGRYIDAGEPVVLIGDPGTGKTHLLIGLGIAACEQGRRVRYATCAQLVNELVEAADERRLARLVGRYGRLDLLLVDEVGYLQLDGRGAELLFQVLTEREERASIGLASNLSFSEWGKVITDPRLVAAVIDRVTFNAHILETGTESYRHRTTRTRKKS